MTKSVFDEREIIAPLPPQLSTELVYQIYKDVILQIPLFKNIHADDISDDVGGSREVITRICMCLQVSATCFRRPVCLGNRCIGSRLIACMKSGMMELKVCSTRL